MPVSDATGLTRSNSNDLWLHNGTGRSPTKPQRALLGPLIFEVGEALTDPHLPPSGPVSWVVPCTDAANYPIPTGPSARSRTRKALSYQHSQPSRTERRMRADDWRLQEAMRPRAGVQQIPANASERQQTGSAALAHSVRALPRSASWSKLRQYKDESATGLATGGRSSGLRGSLQGSLRPSTTCSTLIAKHLDAPRVWASAKPSPRADDVVRAASCATPAEAAALRDEVVHKKVRATVCLLLSRSPRCLCTTFTSYFLSSAHPLGGIFSPPCRQ